MFPVERVGLVDITDLPMPSWERAGETRTAFKMPRTVTGEKGPIAEERRHGSPREKKSPGESSAEP